MHGFNSAILAIFNFAKMALLKPCMKFEFFLSKSIHLKYYQNRNQKNFTYHVPVSTKSRIYAGKSTKWGLSKKAFTRIEKVITVLGSYESLKHLEG